MAAHEIHRWEMVQRLALEKGALQPLVTRADTLENEGYLFSVRVMAGGIEKPVPRDSETPEEGVTGSEKPGTEPTKVKNPFLPYDQELFVCDLAPHHVCLLNKFQVVAPHLLLVTREFQRQEKALDEGDFISLASGLRELDGLGFYNSGRVAGASQPHKHLQLIPFLDRRNTGFPLLSAWDRATPAATGGIWQAPLPFPHALTPSNLAENAAENAVENAAEIDAELQGRRWASDYRQLLDFLHLNPPGSADPAPYNLLVTRKWMFMVPRVREVVEGVSLNALAFAGGLLVRDEVQLERVRQRGPMSLLMEATLPSTQTGDDGRRRKMREDDGR